MMMMMTMVVVVVVFPMYWSMVSNYKQGDTWESISCVPAWGYVRVSNHTIDHDTDGILPYPVVPYILVWPLPTSLGMAHWKSTGNVAAIGGAVYMIDVAAAALFCCKITHTQARHIYICYSYRCP
jgi:hypothetical protein